MRYYISLFIFILAALQLNAQNSDVLTIHGVVFDKKTKKPLPYANISLRDNRLGTVTNINGAFKFRVSSSYKDDSLHISYIGFETIALKLSEIVKGAHIFLVEDTQLLNEVVVTGLTVESILTKAIKKIPENYYSDPYKSKGFYRLKAKKEGFYIRISEAAFDLYHTKESNEKNQLKLGKVREVKDEQILKGIEIGAKPKEILGADIINNLKESGFLDKKGRKNHTFLLEAITSYNGREIFVISFDQKDGIKKSGYRGKLFIDLKTFAFIHLDYGLSPKGIEYHKFGSASQRVLMELFDIKIKAPKNDLKISYKKIEDKYYLSSVYVETIWSIKSSRAHYDFDTDIRLDYLITDIQTENCESFTDEEVLGKNKLIEQQNSIYDQNFWKEHNVILPNFDFTTIAKTISAKNKTQDFKIEIEDLIRKYPKDKAGRIDSILSFYNRKGLFNGNALIAYNKEPIFQKSYNNSLTKNHRKTQFRIGSTSKTFTSMSIMLLENDGKLKVADSIGMYLPEYIHGGVTIEQLLTHQSGIPNYTVNDDYLAMILSEPYSIDELVFLFCSDSLEFDSGSKFEYSNSGFVILSQVIEKITNKTYAQVLKDRIFDPLEMNGSYFGRPTDRTNLAIGYVYEKPEQSYYVQNVIGAGGVTSTTEDLLKWSNAIEKEILLPKEKMNKLFVPRADYADWDADYGYGWMLDRYQFQASKKHQIRYHPGTELGFYSMFLKQPDKNISIILLSNTGDFPRFPITDLILNELN